MGRLLLGEIEGKPAAATRDEHVYVYGENPKPKWTARARMAKQEIEK